MTPARASLFAAPMPGARIGAVGAGALDPEADRQPVDGAVAHQRMDLPRPPDGEVELAADAQAAGILGDGEPAPDRLGRIVLPQQSPHQRLSFCQI